MGMPQIVRFGFQRKQFLLNGVQSLFDRLNFLFGFLAFPFQEIFFVLVNMGNVGPGYSKDNQAAGPKNP
uniref:Uncharacterized protein n=1 Tax=Romanomermis culicivorax TaxID=13658 RepID=A0A915HT97_ROMCU